MTNYRTMKLGDILADRFPELIQKNTLEKHIKDAKESSKPLGQYLIDRKMIDFEHLAQALALQNGVGYANESMIEKTLSNTPLLDAAYSKNNRIIFWKVEGDTRYFLVDTLNNIPLINFLKEKYSPFKLVMASERTINNVMSMQFREDTSEIMKNVKATLNIKEEAEKKEKAETDIKKLLHAIFQSAYIKRASDIHIEPNHNAGQVRLRFRIDGVMVEQHDINLDISIMNALMNSIKNHASPLDMNVRNKPQDGKYQWTKDGKTRELRVSIMPVTGGEKTVFRLAGDINDIPNIDKLGFEKTDLEHFKSAVEKPHGVILLVGPTGSGKTTTLYSAIKSLDCQKKNICTLEDPVEIEIPGVNQTQINEDVGVTWNNSLKALLRQDPDVILVGEIRDSETAQNAFDAANTGHLVFSTLHVNGVAGVASRFKSLDPHGTQDQSMMDNLVCVVSQRLLRRLCSACKEKTVLSERDMEWIRFHLSEEPPVDGSYFKPNKLGCKECSGGYRGRLAVHEMFFMDEYTRNQIKDGETDLPQEIRNQLKNKTMSSRGALNVIRGVTSMEEAIDILGSIH